ncbi:MAG: sugar ABC transporter permease [Chloroflexi bacterium]|nr:sugar ABC transporter permease [Chloroflexota bacterium]MCL5110262.1 sugar ABC transporter permease [Chloroflexota bacterium]
MQAERSLASDRKRPSSGLVDFLDRHARWVLPAPAAIAIVLLCVFPVAYTLYMSFHDWSGSRLLAPQFVGLKNYLDIFLTDDRFHESLVRTAIFTTGALALQLVLGLALSLLFNREFFGRGLLRTLYLLPFVATPAAIALIWMMMYSPPVGVLNYLLSLIGVSGQEWAYGQSQALWALLIVDTWEYTPVIMLICLAGLAALPSDPYESAQIDGANSWQQFWYITLPLLRPTIAVAALFRAIDAIKTFDIIYVMTQGGPGYASETLNIYVFFSAFQYLRFGYSSALLVIFFTIILAVCLVIIKLRREAQTANE